MSDTLNSDTFAKQWEDIKEDIRLSERQRCIQLIRQQARVYLPGYILDKLIDDIESGK